MYANFSEDDAEWAGTEFVDQDGRTLEQSKNSDCQDKDKTRCEVFFKELKEVSHSHTLVLIHFNLPVSC